MKLKANVKVDMGNVPSKVRKVATSKPLGTFLATEAQKGMDKYVPKRTGALAGSATITPFHVTYNAPYATYPYHGRGMTFSLDKNPNATSFWDRAYAIADGQKLGEAGTRFVRSL